MIQCTECEFYEEGPGGEVRFKCNPFATVKEPECVTKHQLLRLDMMTRAYLSLVAEYKKLAPLQQKLYRHMSREVDEMEEADRWKYGEEEDEGEGEEESGPPDEDRL